MPRESYIAPAEGLPMLREDVRFQDLSEDAVNFLARNRVIVLSLFSEDQAKSVRRDTELLLAAHMPVRALRKLLDKVVEEPNSLPPPFRRRPLMIPLERMGLFSGVTRQVIDGVQDLNTDLYAFDAIREIYGSEPHLLTNTLLNRTPKGKWFPRHQDSSGIRGIGFAVQTADTLWQVQPSLTIPGSEDFTFRTYPGDVVVLRERAGDLPVTEPLLLGGGFDSYIPDGSVVHTALNLSETAVRYTLNLFSTEVYEV